MHTLCARHFLRDALGCDAFRVIHFLSVVLGGPFDPLEMPLLGAERPKLFIQLASFSLENRIGIMLSWIGTVRGIAACHPSPQLVGSGVDQVRVGVGVGLLSLLL